jgi:hypothetical protein
VDSLGMRCAEERVERIEYFVKVRLLLRVGGKNRAKQRLNLVRLAMTFDLLKQQEEPEMLLQSYLKMAALEFGN